jgi:hypothetical protein
MPWGDRGVRLSAPADLQLTLFTPVRRGRDGVAPPVAGYAPLRTTSWRRPVEPAKPFIRIIDDGTVGYEETGHDWKTYGEDQAIGKHYRAHLGNKSADTASWKFSGLKSGLRCDVYASWVGWENRSTSVAFTTGSVSVRSTS